MHFASPDNSQRTDPGALLLPPALTAAQQQQGFQEEQTPDGKPEHLNLRGGCPGKVGPSYLIPDHMTCTTDTLSSLFL